MRGTVAFPRNGRSRGRITPACAGNSVPTFGQPHASPDHPRVCGEQYFADSIDDNQPGSPPRVRGTVSPEAAELYQDRITPACAGNRKNAIYCKASKGDHPRVCGEQALAIFSPPHKVGSPPRVRGTGSAAPMRISVIRITPACAGNSTGSYSPKAQVRDHPRVCGEQPPATVPR